MKVKFPVELPKEITNHNQKYKLKGVYLQKMPPGWYPKRKYVEIIYKNDEWGYTTSFNYYVMDYLFKKILNITKEEFLKYQAQIIRDHPEFH